MSAVEAIRVDALDAVPHGFLGRRGGVSSGPYQSLNVGIGSDDDPRAIAENRRRAGDAVLPGGQLVTLYQTHSADAVAICAPINAGIRPQGDALVTDQPGLLLGILTADCAPVLFADRAAGIVGAAHAGWKGALAGVTDAALLTMETLGAERARIVAAIGPCIARASYEVDAGFARRFEADDAANERFFTPGAGDRLQFDLEGYVAHRLADAGVETIVMLGIDTYAEENRFFSYRRATHRGEDGYGRQISLIGLPID